LSTNHTIMRRKKLLFQHLYSKPPRETWITRSYNLKKESISDPLIIVRMQFIAYYPLNL